MIIGTLSLTKFANDDDDDDDDDDDNDDLSVAIRCSYYLRHCIITYMHNSLVTNFRYRCVIEPELF